MYNLSAIKSIPCRDVAERFGINLTQKHNRLWGTLRNEKTASFSINLDKNLWYDFGSREGGSVIDLYALLADLSKADALIRLAEEYGLDSEKSDKWRPLSDKGYSDLGIKAERATLNFEVDLDMFSFDVVKRWSEKYGMHVKDLAVKHPELYDKMVMKIAVETISSLRGSYFESLKLANDSNANHVLRGLSERSYKTAEILINGKVDLLQKALLRKIDTSFLKVNSEVDRHDVTMHTSKEMVGRAEDDKLRYKIVDIYKQTFNYSLVDYFTTDQAKALIDVNALLVKEPNKFLSIKSIREIHQSLGNNIDQLESQIEKHQKEGVILNKGTEERNFWEEKARLLTDDLLKAKEIFSKCSIVIDANNKASIIEKTEVFVSEIVKIDFANEL